MGHSISLFAQKMNEKNQVPYEHRASNEYAGIDKAHWHSIQEAQAASAAEHSTTLREALKENWKAVLWSAAISLTIVMEGYDQRLVPWKWKLFTKYVVSSYP